MPRKTWTEFWGEFLLVRFHAGDPARWTSRERKAEWVWKNLKLSKGHRVLDLGCGDGILDICLARMGTPVVAVDRIGSVLRLARKEAGPAPVQFMHGDLRELSYRPESFDRIILFETVGLMNEADDRSLVWKSRTWLRKGGMMAIDCLCPPNETRGRNTREFPEGLFVMEWTYNRETRLQHIVPTFRETGGETIELHDPYDPSKEDHTGVVRFLYPKPGLTQIMTEAGFAVAELPHYSSQRHYLLIGEA